MKYIFDFDDVLFENTAKFKPYIYSALESYGIPQETAESYYRKVRENEFSMQTFISDLLAQHKIKANVDKIYKDIMRNCLSFVNRDLRQLIGRLGRDNCFLVTTGDTKFQNDKIDNSGIRMLFEEVYVVPDSKKEVVEEIYKRRRRKGEKVIFVDDKKHHLEDIDPKKCPDLITVLYDENGFARLNGEIDGEASELSRKGLK
jgi:FMN phosphatase YigB (HAD superfamily)